MNCPSSPRLIPAHAGKTIRNCKRSTRRAAHPRSRGENVIFHLKGMQLRGSSPLTRGKPRAASLRGLRVRLIPAHAGKTITAAGPALRAEAHPRSRGENPPTTAPLLLRSGSSPLTRGKHTRRPGSARRARLIPAHAGKTRTRASTEPAPCRVPGSSPLTRGKRLRAWRAAPVWRLIPAHAGKTTQLRALYVTHEAHPRSRGENYVSHCSPRASTGSSPLTRGKRVGVDALEVQLRLIPAHAGKTL